ncbi:MAG: septum formation protein Maf [Bacteroidaceae bacterium]|nr:septum formation protein Maf [Bacteroidaceae bacterium]MBQ8674816.1 septum formation protein Maf [Bacteroidaceae bacterium]MBQ9175467.1 septum formation protein Maf [Bacteroidaceae bacterium]MBR1378372.1 septum formation protein Maf [Bacteroidaceae bacterium]
MKIVLASNSPRRKELLAGLELDFEVRTMNGIDESYPAELRGEDIPTYISQQKARAYLPTLADDELLITADTIVYLDHVVLGKPANRDEAIHMLKALSGRRHDVITGVTLATKDKSLSFASTTRVEFAQLSDDDICHYVDVYRPFDKAGAYGIQEWIGYIGVRSIEGSYFNVMGLPVQRLSEALKVMYKS